MTAAVAADQRYFAGGKPMFLPLVVLGAGIPVGATLLCYGLWRLLRSPDLRRPPVRCLPTPSRSPTSRYSPHRGYWYLGPPPDTSGVVVLVGDDSGQIRRHFTEARRVATVDNPRGLPALNAELPVWVCSGQDELRAGPTAVTVRTAYSHRVTDPSCRRFTGTSCRRHATTATPVAWVARFR
jgi:hypothetical protein